MVTGVKYEDEDERRLDVAAEEGSCVWATQDGMFGAE